MTRIVPHLWYAERAEEAVRLYVSLLTDSRIDHLTTMPAESPSGPAGSVTVIEFTLLGQPFMAIEAGPLDPFNHAISLLVECADQAEVDRLWCAFLDGGGTAERCGWLKDRYGVSWQIVPAALGPMMRDPDRVRAARVAQAMLQMVKIDVTGLERAYVGA